MGKRRGRHASCGRACGQEELMTPRGNRARNAELAIKARSSKAHLILVFGDPEILPSGSLQRAAAITPSQA